MFKGVFGGLLVRHSYENASLAEAFYRVWSMQADEGHMVRLNAEGLTPKVA